MAENRSYFGPGNLTSLECSPFKISEQQWKRINDYVNKIAIIGSDAESVITAFIPAFRELKIQAIQWKQETFPKIIELAKSISYYGSVTVINNYEKLNDIINLLNIERRSGEKLDEFNSIMSQLQNCSNDIIQSTYNVVTLIESFTEAINTASKQSQKYTSTRNKIDCVHNESVTLLDISQSQILQHAIQVVVQLASIMGDIKFPPLVIFEKMQGVWEAIQSDLEYIQNEINTQIRIDKPLLDDLAILEAKEEWKSVAEDAEKFIQYAKELR